MERHSSPGRRRIPRLTYRVFCKQGDCTDFAEVRPTTLDFWGFAPGSAQAEGVCSILRDSHTLSGVERGCLLATAGAGGTAEEPAWQQLERGGELLRLQPQPACATQNAQETTSGQLS